MVTVLLILMVVVVASCVVHTYWTVFQNHRVPSEEWEQIRQQNQQRWTFRKKGVT